MRMDARFTRGVKNGIRLRQSADVAGVDAQLGCTALRGLDGDLRVEMDVGNNGKGRFRAHLLKGIKAVLTRDGHANVFAAGLGQTLDLREIAVGILGGHVQHRLDDNRRTPANRDVSNHHAMRQFMRQSHGFPLDLDPTYCDATRLDDEARSAARVRGLGNRACAARSF